MTRSFYGEFISKNLDSTGYREPNATLGAEPGQSLRLLHVATLGLLRDIRLPRLPSARTRKAALGVGFGNHGFGL